VRLGKRFVNRFFKSKAALVREIKSLRRELDQIKQSERSLRLREQAYRRLVELSPVAMTVHAQGKYLYANQAAVELAGLSKPADLVGQPVTHFVHPHETDLAGKQISPIIQNQGDGAGASLHKLVRTDGQTIDILVSSAAIPFQGQTGTLAINAPNTIWPKRCVIQLPCSILRLIFPRCCAAF
jgi:PAS domain S-box-containing protein